MGLPLQKTAFAKPLDQLYELPLRDQARVLHLTDIHAQLNPVYFREPNVNFGPGESKVCLAACRWRKYAAETGSGCRQH